MQQAIKGAESEAMLTRISLLMLGIAAALAKNTQKENNTNFSPAAPMSPRYMS